MGCGFSGLRAKLYQEALAEYPDARKNDIKAMYRYLNPQLGEYILGFGEGNGYFCREIAEALGPHGKYLVTDPSQDLLKNLRKRINLPQIEVLRSGAEELEVATESYDKVWSFGAFHHLDNQTKAMTNIYRALKPGGKVVICDVFQGSRLAKHFDIQVGRYSITGHEVKFLSEEFAKTLCYVAGFEDQKVDLFDLNIKWLFHSENDLGLFIYKLHAMTKFPGTEQEKIKQTLEGCRKILGIEYKQGIYELNWPIKVLTAKKTVLSQKNESYCVV